MGFDYTYDHKNLLLTELSFWEDWFKTQGGKWNGDYLNRTNNNSEIDKNCWFMSDVSIDDKILDVGCGPIPKYGFKLNGVKLNIIGTDPLADRFNKLLEKYTPDVEFRGMCVSGENLLDSFSDAEFDKVFSINAIDHSHNPILCIQNMIKVCKKTGIVKINVYKNEGKHERYHGLHKWNFTVERGKLKLWNCDGNAFIEDHIDCQDIQSNLNGRSVNIQIKP
tara:strand:+ start:65891 stop:66556 length:666 start_codon:yes stop_codon:yes gene_type:complete